MRFQNSFAPLNRLLQFSFKIIEPLRSPRNECRTTNPSTLILCTTLHFLKLPHNPAVQPLNNETATKLGGIKPTYRDTCRESIRHGDISLVRRNTILLTQRLKLPARQVVEAQRGLRLGPPERRHRSPARNKLPSSQTTKRSSACIMSSTRITLQINPLSVHIRTVFATPTPSDQREKTNLTHSLHKLLPTERRRRLKAVTKLQNRHHLRLS